MLPLTQMLAPLGAVTAPTRAIAAEVCEQADKAGHAPRNLWGLGSSAEHATGAAIDFMVSSQDDGDWIAEYLWANRARFRLRHQIWRQHIRTTDPGAPSPGVWRAMEDRGSVTENHYDHIHAILDATYAIDGATEDIMTPAQEAKLDQALAALANLQLRVAQANREDYAMQSAILAAIRVDDIDEARLAEEMAKRGITGADPKALAAAVVDQLAERISEARV